ncbi:MAG TPA: hypothetical protein VGL39_20025 [Jatrophihabitantaceae bacterium]|jgi:hypothetical protein
MAGLGTLGVIVLQAAAAASVIGFFARRSDRRWWRTFRAPAIGFAGLVAATVLVLQKFSVLTGTKSAVVNSLPWLIAAAAVGGFGYAYWLRAHRPGVYQALATDAPAPTPAPTPVPLAATPEPA